MGYFDDLRARKESGMNISGIPLSITNSELAIADALSMDFYRTDTGENMGKAHEEVISDENGLRTTHFVLDSGGIVALAEEKETDDNGRSVVAAEVTVYENVYVPENRRMGAEGGEDRPAPAVYSMTREYNEDGSVSRLSGAYEERRFSYNGDGTVSRMEADRQPGSDSDAERMRLVIDFDSAGRVASADSFECADARSDGSVEVIRQRAETARDVNGNAGRQVFTVDKGYIAAGDAPWDSAHWESTEISEYNGNVLGSRIEVEHTEDGDIWTTYEYHENGEVRTRTEEYENRVEVKEYAESGWLMEERVTDYNADKKEAYSHIIRNEYSPDGNSRTERIIIETRNDTRAGYIGSVVARTDSTLMSPTGGSYVSRAERVLSSSDDNVRVETRKETRDETSRTVSRTVVFRNDDGTEKYRIEKTYNDDNTIDRKFFEDGEVRSFDKGIPDESGERMLSVETSEGYSGENPAGYSSIEGGTREKSVVYDEDGSPVSCEISYYDSDGEQVASETVLFDDGNGYESVIRDEDGNVVRQTIVNDEGERTVVDEKEYTESITNDIEEAITDIFSDLEERIIGVDEKVDRDSDSDTPDAGPAAQAVDVDDDMRSLDVDAYDGMAHDGGTEADEIRLDDSDSTMLDEIRLDDSDGTASDDIGALLDRIGLDDLDSDATQSDAMAFDDIRLDDADAVIDDIKLDESDTDFDDIKLDNEAGISGFENDNTCYDDDYDSVD